MLASSQLPVTPGPGDPTPSSGLYTHICALVYVHTRRFTHQTLTQKTFLKEKAWIPVLAFLFSNHILNTYCIPGLTSDLGLQQ